MDIAWLRDDSGDAEEGLSEPEDIAAAILGHLRAALDEIESLTEEFSPDANLPLESVEEAQ